MFELPTTMRPGKGYSVIVDPPSAHGSPRRFTKISPIVLVGVSCLLSAVALLGYQRLGEPPAPMMGDVSSSDPLPLSYLRPVEDLGVHPYVRTTGQPSSIWGSLLTQSTPLPTNSWWQNFVLGDDHNSATLARVFVIPYVIDMAGAIPGPRSHASGVKAGTNTVEQAWNPGYGITIGSVEKVGPQTVRDYGTGGPKQFGIELLWSATDRAGAFLSAPIVRGSPYTTVTYHGLSAKIVAEIVPTNGQITVDGTTTHQCWTLGDPDFNVTADASVTRNASAFWVEKEIEFTLTESDATWLVFVSSPGWWRCDYRDHLPATNGHQNTKPFFRMEAGAPFGDGGGVRLALVNNCTTAKSDPMFCSFFVDPVDYSQGPHEPHNRTSWAKLLRQHAGVWPSVDAAPLFVFPAERRFSPVSGELLMQESTLDLQIDWGVRTFFVDSSEESKANYENDDAAYKSALANGIAPSFAEVVNPLNAPGALELLMLALPHHRDALTPTAESSNAVVGPGLGGGCAPTLHGEACAAVGSIWSLSETLFNVSFYAPDPIRPELYQDLSDALDEDLTFDLPDNYRRGAGDTYFSGKMLAKLARIVIISDQMGADFLNRRNEAVKRLAKGVTVWLDGTSENPFIYDDTWGGLASCGCDYNEETTKCNNVFPDCPAMSDMGNNFGFSFFNDHHFHLGYHLYAAATVGLFDNEWLRLHWDKLLLYVRDIANPSRHDPHFPAARHKDWYLGSSWASGVVTANPNGRNEESSAEAIAAYEGVALLGEAGMMAFSTMKNRMSINSPGTNDESAAWAEGFATASRIYDFGRLLLSTEVRSAQRYWHVRASPAPRVYPDMYTPKVVGMLWQMLAQEQTWFGPEEWKSYGIQLLPFTPASAKRDDPNWVAEMLPPFNASCAATPVCKEQGWSILVLLSMGTLGKWQEARKGIMALPASAFEGAGGNGHSRTNSLWWIATRPPESAPPPPHKTSSAAPPNARAGSSTLTVAGRALLGAIAAATALSASSEF